MLNQLYQLELLDIRGPVILEVLPPALRELVLHDPHPAIKTFSRWPPSLSSLRIASRNNLWGASFTQFSMTHPPVGLKKLELDYNTLQSAVVPEGVECVRVGASYGTFVWPASLKEVHFVKLSMCGGTHNIYQEFDRIGLPKSIRRVTIGGVEFTRSGYRK